MRLSIFLVVAVGALAACDKMKMPTSESINEIAARDIQAMRGALAVTPNEIDLSNDLDAALPGAIRASDRYRAARAREIEAAATIRAARSASRPQASVTARAGQLRETGASSDSFSGAYGNLTISQLISDGGETRSTIEGSLARANAARAERLATGNEVALNASSAWLELWLANERIRLLDDRIGSMETLVDQIERLAANGMVDATTLDSARRQLVDIDLQRAQMRQALTSAQTQFRRHFKALPEGRVNLPELISSEQARRLASNWETAPEINISAAELIAARANVERIRASFTPRASLQAGSNSPIDENDPTTHTLGVAVEYQIYSGGRRQADLDAAESRAQAAEASLADRIQMFGADLDSLIAQLDAAEAAIELAQQRVELTSAEQEAARSQLVTGQSDLRSLVDAEISGYRAADQMLEARARRSELALAVAARTGWLLERLGLEE